MSTDLGGWLLKCNPKVSALDDLLVNGVNTWCVRPGRRAKLIEAGQDVFFWVTGPAGTDPVPGVWALGRTTGQARVGPAGKLVAPVQLEFLADPVPRTRVAAVPELARLEVLRQPAMSNPSWVTRAEAAVLRRLSELMQPGRSPFPY